MMPMWRVRLGLHPFGGRAGDLKLSVVSLDLQIYGRLNLTLIRANSRTILSRIQLGDRQFLALVREAGFGSVTNLYLCSAVADFNSAVPPDKALQIHSLLSASLVSQKELSSTLDTCMFNLLLETSSNADQARLLSVSAPHASSWLSVLPSQGLGLHLDAPVHEVAIKWWLGMDTSQGSQCALCPGNALDPLGHHATTLEAGNDPTADHSHTHPADLLLTNWTTGKTAAFDISVTSPLNTHTLMEAGVSAGSAALPVKAESTGPMMQNAKNSAGCVFP
eukprot:Em0003g349a